MIIYILVKGGSGTEGKDVVSACAIAGAGCVFVGVAVSHVARRLEQLRVVGGRASHNTWVFQRRRMRVAECSACLLSQV